MSLILNTGIPHFMKVICSMETVPKVKLRKLKFKFPCTSYIKPAELMNASCSLQ